MRPLKTPLSLSKSCYFACKVLHRNSLLIASGHISLETLRVSIYIYIEGKAKLNYVTVLYYFKLYSLQNCLILFNIVIYVYIERVFDDGI